MFCIKFSESNANQIRQLTNTLQNNTILSQNQWQQVCGEMDQMVRNISKSYGKKNYQHTTLSEKPLN
jgi:conjugal transfer/entry exclusion protein